MRKQDIKLAHIPKVNIMIILKNSTPYFLLSRCLKYSLLVMLIGIKD